MFKLRKFKPTHWVYLVAHTAMVVVGFSLAAYLKSAVGGAVATSIAAAGITGLVIFLYIFVNDDFGERIKQITRMGFSEYFSSRGSTIRTEYDRRLTVAKESIDVIGFGLKALNEDHRSSFESWKRRARVRVLLIDPEYPSSYQSLAHIRDVEEGHPEGTIRDEVRRFIDAAATVCDERFQVRLARCIPSVNLFRVDDDMFWGPYLAKKVSRNSPTFLVHRNGELFKLLMEHFEAIWSDPILSREVPESWLAGR